MPIILDPKLYEKAKLTANEKYKKPSAYKSGFIVKTYKELGGRYQNDHREKNLKRWYNERWADIGNENYPVYRPTIRISTKTPKLVKDINPTHLKEQIKLKQKIKGRNNLPPF